MIMENSNKGSMSKKKIKNNSGKAVKKVTKKIIKNPNGLITKEVALFKDLENNFLHVKVGTSEKPATDIEIKSIEGLIVKLFKDNSVNCIAFVTHHAVCIEIIEKKKSID